MAAPVIEAGDCTNSASDTAQASWVVSTPAASAGDLLIFCLGWDDSVTVASVTPPTGPNGETLTSIAGPVASASTEVRCQAWRTVATGSWSAGTLTFTPAASESWRATVVRVPAGEFDASTPIGAAATRASGSTTSTTVLFPDMTLGADDGGGRLVAMGCIDADPVTATPSGWTDVSYADIGGHSTFVSVRGTETSNSEAIDGDTFSWTIASDSWATLGFVVRGPAAPPDPASASLTETLDPATLSADAIRWTAATASLTETLEAASLSADGTAGIAEAEASLSATLDPATLTAEAEAVLPVMLARPANTAHTETSFMRLYRGAAILLLLIGPPPEATAELTATLDSATLSATVSTANPARTASLSDTLSPATLSASGTLANPPRTASLTETLAPATLSASGSVSGGSATASLSETLDAAALSASASTGTNAATATLSETLDAATLSASVSTESLSMLRRPLSTVHIETRHVTSHATAKTLLLRLSPTIPRTASLAASASDATLSATATLTNPARTASLTETAGAVTLSAAATLTSPPRSAALTETLAPATLAAEAGISSADVSGSLSEALDPATLSAAASLTNPAATASLSVTLDPATLSASGNEVSVSVLVRHRAHFRTVDVLVRGSRASDYLLPVLTVTAPSGATAALSETLDPAALTAAATLTSPPATGSLSATLEDATLSAYETEPPAGGTVFYRPRRVVVLEESIETTWRYGLAGGPIAPVLPASSGELTGSLADATLLASAVSGAPVSGVIIGDLLFGTLADATLSAHAFTLDGATMMLGRESRPWAFQKSRIQLKAKRWPGIVTTKPPETATLSVTLDAATLSAAVTISEPAAGTLAALSGALEDAGLSAAGVVFDGVDLFLGRENRPEAYPQEPPQLRSKRTREPPLGEEEPPPPGTHVGSLTATLADATLSAGLFIGDPLPEALASLTATLEDARLEATNILPPPPPTYIGSGEQLEAAAEAELLRKVREYWEERERSEAQARLMYLIELVDAIDEAEEAEWRSNPFGDS